MDRMRVRTKIGIGVASAAALAAIGVGVAVADDQEITGPAADQARAAAVQAVPGKAGKVEKETNEGTAYYGVLVTKTDGTRVEVHLDQGFHFLGTEAPDND
jgi:Peptidase propeptide and YPEB domain